MAPISIKKPSAPVVDPIAEARSQRLKSTNTAVVVAAAGEVLRRKESAGKALVEQAQQALMKLNQSDVEASLKAISVAACRSDVSRAAEQAFDAAFADSAEERAELAKSALASLRSRDDIESTLFAAKSFASDRKVSLDVDASAADLGRLDGELGRSLGRSLTGINAERRASLAELDPSERDRAVWFGSFLDADDLLPALGGTKTSDLSAASRQALATAALPGKSSDATVAAALAHVAMKSASAEEKALLTSRAQRSSALARDLAEAERPYELEEPEA